MTTSTTSEFLSHRARSYGEEASVLAIRKALESKINGLLLDLRLTKDKKWVIPKKTSRNAIYKIHHQVASSLKKDVTDIDVVLALCSVHSKDIYLDLRDMGAYLGLITKVRRYNLIKRVIFCSWDANELERIHELEPTARLGFCLPNVLEDLEVHTHLPRAKIKMIYHKRQGFDGLHGIKPSQRNFPDLPILPLEVIFVPNLMCIPKFIDQIKDKGALPIAYTVNSKITARILQRQGIGKVLSDAKLR